MSITKREFLIAVFIAFAIATGLIGFFHGSGNGNSNSDTKDEQVDANVVAKVKIAYAQLKTMDQTITAYGSVIAAPENLAGSTVPFESKVGRILVTPGQMVTSGTILMEIEPSYEAMLQLEEAKSAQATAAMEFEQAKKRLELKLGTQQDMAQAQQASELANTKLKNIEDRGIKNIQLKAQVDGIIRRVDVQQGQIVSAGNALIEIAPYDRLEIRLGVEPSQAAQLQTGMQVEIRNVNNTEPNSIPGRIRLISHQLNPSSRMVDTFITLLNRCLLPLDTYVRGRIIIGSRQVLTVPRSAVLNDGEHYNLFTIKDGKALKHTVNIGLQDESSIEVISSELKANDPVVIEGNYELDDGMAAAPEDAR
jgi:RND family efflux transporter MFP subunit